MFRVRLHLPDLKPSPDRLAAAADALRDEVADTLADGGNEDVRLAPTVSGRPFRGVPLLDHLRAVVSDGKPAVEVDHPAAQVLLLGTKAKGGKLDSLRPVRARALSWVAGGVRRFFARAEFPPRNYLRLSAAARARVASVLLLGRKPN